MIKRQNGLKIFYQWDLDQQLQLTEIEGDLDVHFWQEGQSEALVVEPTKEGDVQSVNVPNILLQNALPIKVYIWRKDIGAWTAYQQVFQVIGRGKPADYVYTETEIKGYEALEKRIEALEENGGGGSTTTPDWNQNDPSQPDYVKNRTHYSSKAFEDITWDGDETGHEVVAPWDEDERFVKVSASGFEVNDLIGATIYLTDGTVEEITTDTSFDVSPGGYIIDYNILVVNSAEELNNAWDVPNGAFSKGIYFISAYGDPFVTKLAFPETVKKLDKKYLPKLEYNDLSNIPDIPKVDQTYTSTSENAQSGKAVTEAMAEAARGSIPRVPLVHPGGPFYSAVVVQNNGAFDSDNTPLSYHYTEIEDEGVGIRPGWLVRRKANSTISTETPVDAMDCANKKYVDDAIANIDVGGGSSGNYVPIAESNYHTDQAYIVDSTGQQMVVEIEDTGMYEGGINLFNNNLPRRKHNGNLQTQTPTTDLECANKKYVDGLIESLIKRIEILEKG